MNGALWDDLIAAGGQAVIPDELVTRHKIGRDRVWSVLTFLVVNANSANQVWMSPAYVARMLGAVVPRQRVDEVYRLLREAGILVPMGKRERSILYGIDVQPARDPVQDHARRPARRPAREHAREHARDAVHKQELKQEHKQKQRARADDGAGSTTCLPALLEMINAHGRRLTPTARLRHVGDQLDAAGIDPARVYRTVADLIDLNDPGKGDGLVVHEVESVAADLAAAATRRTAPAAPSYYDCDRDGCGQPVRRGDVCRRHDDDTSDPTPIGALVGVAPPWGTP